MMDTWIDLTDYCPTAYGYGDNPTEPIWNFMCPKCENHVFTKYPPDICPECRTRLKL